MDLVRFFDKPAAIVGTTGSGKTFTAKGVVEQLLAEKRRVIIIDPTGAWYGLRAGADAKASGGFPVMIFGGAHADVPVEPTSDAGEALALAIAGRDVQAIIDTSEMTGGEKNRFLTAFLERLYATNKAALHLIVDEADEIAAQRLADGEQRLFGAFDKIVRRGRIKGFRPVMITQRPAVIHKNVLSQIGTLVALKLTSPQDRKAIEDWVKGNADADQAREVMKSLPTLARGEGWVWSPADGVLKRTRFPKIKTFDSSRTPLTDEIPVKPALTAVDVKGLRAAMAAKTEDPKKTRAAGAGAQDLKAAEDRGYARGYELAKKDGHANSYRAGYWAAVKSMADVSNGLLKNLQPDDIEIPPLAVTSSASAPVRTALRAAPVKDMPASIGAELKPLMVLVSVHPAGYTEAQWASLAGFKRTGGTWSTYKSRLRTRGLVQQVGGLWYATSAAVDEFSTSAEAAPSTPDERLAMWRQKISGVGPMIDALKGFYPRAVTRDALAGAINMAASGGTFGTYLSRLRSNGLIEEPEKGAFRLSATLMEEANG